MNDGSIFIVTDGEFDGPIPGKNSMLSFASVAITPTGEVIDEFEAVLEPLQDATQNPETMAFWQTIPEAYAAATLNPENPKIVMKRFVEWIRNLGGLPVFVSHPLAADGPWLDYYLQRFTGEPLIEGPWRKNRLFKGAPLCLVSFMAGRLDWSPPWEEKIGRYPPEWLGHQAHTHRAIDDARGYAHLLVYLLNKDSAT